MSVRSNIYGLTSSNCPLLLVPQLCYEHCAHTNYVLNQTLPLIGNPEYLESLLKGILKTQEHFIQAVCEYQPDLCKLGEILGFPCVQCGYVIQPVFDLCPTYGIECGDTKYSTVDPCKSLCTPLCSKECISTTFDFTTSGESLALYESIITALVTFNGEANWSGIDQFIKLVFGDEAGVVTFQAGTYYLSIGREMTEFETNAANIILSAFPVPIGANVQFVERVC